MVRKPPNSYEIRYVWGDRSSNRLCFVQPLFILTGHSTERFTEIDSYSQGEGSTIHSSVAHHMLGMTKVPVHLQGNDDMIDHNLMRCRRVATTLWSRDLS